MADRTRTLTLTEEAYRRLDVERRAGESFIELILRLLPRTNLEELVGILTADQGAAVAKAIEATREELGAEVEERARRLQGGDLGN